MGSRHRKALAAVAMGLVLGTGSATAAPSPVDARAGYVEDFDSLDPDVPGLDGATRFTLAEGSLCACTLAIDIPIAVGTAAGDLDELPVSDPLQRRHA